MKEIVKPIIGNHVAAHDRFPHVPTQAAHLGYGGLGVLVDDPAMMVYSKAPMIS